MRLQKIINRLQKLHPKEIDLSLDRIRTLCKKLGNPQDEIECIQVCGTNGKGSTISFLRSILKEADIKCNIYTSPHVKRINERFIFNDEMISDDDLSDLLNVIDEINDGQPLTYFEALTAAFFYGCKKFKNNLTITEFGLFIGLSGDIDGMAHLSDLSWHKTGEEALSNYNKGDTVKAKVLGVDVEKERISLGIKQLTEDPFESEVKSIKKGATVTCTITAVVDGGLEVRVGEGLSGFIRKGDLSRDRSGQRVERFAAGEKIDAKVMQIDTASRKLTLSVKSLEAAEEKKAMKEYGSSDSGASLGDILGAAIKEKQDSEPKEKSAKKSSTKKTTEKKVEKSRILTEKDFVTKRQTLCSTFGQKFSVKILKV